MTTPELIKLGADNDQDRAEVDDWMRTVSDEVKLGVWQRLVAQYKHPTDPFEELVARLAMLALGESAERIQRG